MNAELFFQALSNEGAEMFCGVPDSLLKDLCACIKDKVDFKNNIIAANEGNALATAAGYYLASGIPGVVYMQNSGLGNIINPLLSLVDPDVYNIPVLMIIGWRGEPGVHDEPQHITQGRLTMPLLDTMGIKYEVLTDISQVPVAFQYMKNTNRPFAFIVQKGCFESYPSCKTTNEYQLARECAIRSVVNHMDSTDIVVSTTGMISRELYECRETHEKDFLTVGSMGHASSIAFGIAVTKPNRKVFCLDGDGAFLMHMGAAPVIASRALSNFKHIIINNEAHDSVGGQPTIMNGVKLPELLLNSGYKNVHEAYSEKQIHEQWDKFALSEETSALIIHVKTGARKDLGRPKEKPQENKQAFMNFLQEN